MPRWPGGLLERYRAHHEDRGALLVQTATIGVVAFPLMYLVRLTGRMPPMYDDLPWRTLAFAMCLVLTLRRRWPPALKRHYLTFSYATVWYCLAFLLPFTLLHNGANAPTIVNVLIAAALIVLLTDWRNTLVMLLSGYAISTVVYWFTSSAPTLPLSVLVWYVPMCAVLLGAIYSARHTQRQPMTSEVARILGGSLAVVAHDTHGRLQMRDHRQSWQGAQPSVVDKHVLLVGSDPSMRLVTRMKLESIGCEISEAHNGADALESLAGSRFDVLLVHVNMPGMDGFLLTRCIRQGAIAGREKVPIIGYSTMQTAESTRLARHAGLDDFLSADCTSQQLAGTIWRTQSADPRARRPDVPTLAGCSVLLVDGHASRRWMIKGHLEHVGANVIEAEHGGAILQLLGAGLRPAAIVMDLDSLNPAEANARAVRASSTSVRQIPILALTSDQNPKRHVQALEAGINVVLQKPVGREALQVALLRHVRPSPPRA